MSPSPVVLTDITAESSADTTKECHRVNVLYNTQGSSEIHLTHWNPRLAAPEIFNLHSCPASVFCIVQPCIPARGNVHTKPLIRTHIRARGSKMFSDECTGSFWGSGCTKSADDGPTFYFILLYSEKNPRALMHSILKTPQTKSLKPLEKFLRDQQVSLLHSTGDSPGWLMTHPASASLDTGGEMNKWIKPWVSRHQALRQTKARLEISAQGKWKRECTFVHGKEREQEWDKMRDASKAAVILSGHSMLAHAYPYIYLESWRTWKQGTGTLP